MRRRRGALSPTAAGLVMIVVASVIVYFGFTKALPFAHHFSLKALFPSANNIQPGSPVRIAGVNVGKVTGVHLLRAGGPVAEVDMRIDSQGLPIHRDATLKIRPRIFLEGNFFVDLSPGSPSAPDVKSGQEIPLGQTADPVQFDQILSALPSATRRQLQQLLAGLATGLAGPGAASFNRAIPYFEPAEKYGSIVSDALLGTNLHDLSRYVASAGRTAQATDADRPALRGLVTNLNITAAALAAQDTALAQTIVDLPGTLSTGRKSLADLDRALPSLDALGKDLLPGTRSALPAVNASIPLADQLRALVQPDELRGLVHDLGPTIPALDRLNTEQVPLLDQVRAASSCQDNVIVPWSHMTVPDPNFPAQGPVYQEGVKFLPGVGGESRNGDANGKWFHLLLLPPSYVAPAPGGQLLLESLPDIGANPPSPDHRPPLRADVPCETQQPPKLTTQVGPPPAGQRPVPVMSSPSALAIKAEAQRRELGLMQRWLDRGGTAQVRVSATPLSPAQVPKLRALTRAMP